MGPRTDEVWLQRLLLLCFVVLTIGIWTVLAAGFFL